jgi:hypothetical protein
MNVPDFLDMVKGTMLRGARVTADKEEEIIADLTERSHPSRVAREIGDVSFSTVWRVAERAGIELTAGREAKGYKRPRGSCRERLGFCGSREPVR